MKYRSRLRRSYSLAREAGLPKVFKPSGMNTTYPTNTKVALPNRAQGYWDAMLYTDKILSDSTRRQMWTPVTLNNGTSYPYGFGWQLESLNGRRAVHHSGGGPGARTKFARFVDDRLTIIVLMNLDDVDVDSIVHGIAARYLPAPTPSRTR